MINSLFLCVSQKPFEQEHLELHNVCTCSLAVMSCNHACQLHVDMNMLIWTCWYDHVDMIMLIWTCWYDHRLPKWLHTCTAALLCDIIYRNMKLAVFLSNANIYIYHSLWKIRCEKIFVGRHVWRNLNTRKFSYHKEIE